MPDTQYFLGANTPSGFYSLYHELSDPDKFKRVYVIKSGPGSGKSTLMRQVGRRARAAGYDVEEILCSGDPGSLDAVIVPALGAAVVDGTSPHVIEPECPGVIDRYLDLSDYYDREGLQPLKDDILAAFAEYKGHYKRAYRCLGAAGELRQNMSETLDTEALQHKMAKRAAGIIGREIRKGGPGEGRCDQRFLNAVSCQGRMVLWDTVSAQADRVYELADGYGLSHHLLAPILSAALAAGHDAVACPDPMAPNKLAHVILPELGLAFVTSAPENPWPGRPYRRVRVDAMVDPALYRAGRPRLRFTKRVAGALMDDGIAGLVQAKEAHDRLEVLYHPYVDFGGVARVADRVAEEILG